ncbi:MAG: hypothetical protein RI580_09870 [Halothece sp. Uz-M2-17]|nr:hypothetical protein [Halothece sp. Uz-M2-17]
MNNVSKNSLLNNLDEPINLAIKKALERHQKLGESVVVSQNGENKILLANYPNKTNS